MKPQTSEAFYTSAESSKALHVHQQTIGVMIRSGKLKARKVGNVWQVDPVSLELERNRRKQAGTMKRRKGGPRLRKDLEEHVNRNLREAGFDPSQRAADTGSAMVRSESVSKALQDSRKTTRLSAQALSKFAGYAINYVHRVERNERSISREAVKRIAIVIRAADGDPTALVVAFMDSFNREADTKPEA